MGKKDATGSISRSGSAITLAQQPYSMTYRTWSGLLGNHDYV